MNTAIEDAHSLTAGSASDRPGITVIKIAIATIFLSTRVLKFSADEADSRDQTP
jgi:hypothetical protein